MKLELDTTNKTIKINEEVNLKEFIKVIDKLLPNKIWYDYTLFTNVVINWSNPVTIINPIRPVYPWIEYNNPVNPYEITCGTYCIDIN